MVKEIFKRFCPSFETKNGRAKDEQDKRPVVKINTIQNLISQGDYMGLSSFVRAEGAFVQYRADGSYYRRVGLGITHNEFLIVSQILNDFQDEDIGELKIDLIFPLPVLHFFLLDQAAKRFAVCTCVGVLMFFAMCEDEPNTSLNWDKWRRVIVPLLSQNLRESPWQHVWTSPYILNLSERNDVPAFEYLATKKGKQAKRKLHFTQYPFTLRLVHSFGVQTDDKIQYPTSVVRPHVRAKTDSVQPRSMAIPSADIGNTNVVTKRKQLESKPLRYNGEPKYRSKEGDGPKADLIQKEAKGDRQVKPVYGFSYIKGEKEKTKRKHTDSPNNYYQEAPDTSVWNQSTATGKVRPVQDIDFVLNESKKPMKFQTVPDQRLPMFYGGCRLLQHRLSTSSRRKSYGRPIRRSVSCDDLLLTNYGRRRTRLDQMVARSWNPLVSTSPRLNSSDKRLSKKFNKFTQKMQEQASKGPLEMSSPTADTEDIDQLVKEFSEKNEPEETKRSGRDLWMIARKKLLCRDTVMLERLQNVVTTYVFKVSHRSSAKAKQLTDLTPLAVSLELHSVSRKLFLSITASDILIFHHQGIQAARSFSKILAFQDVISKVVIAQILGCKNLLDRIDALKFFIEVCLNLLTKNNDFQSFVSVMCALMSLPVYRMRNSWATFYMEYPFHFSYLVCMGKVLSGERGFASYMSRIETAWSCGRPFIPWIEHFLVHCKKQPVCRRNGHRLMLKSERIMKEQNVRKEDAPRDTKYFSKKKQPDELRAKSQKHRKQFQKSFKPKKKLKFSSEVDVAEGHPSNHAITRGSKVPLGSPIVDIDLPSEYLEQDVEEKFDLFCEETAAHVIDGAMKNLKEDIEGLQRIRRRSGKVKPSHQKTSGHYLKKKVSLDHEDFTKERQKEDKGETKIAKTYDEARRRKLASIKRTIREQALAKEKERKQTEMEEQGDKHGLLKVFDSWKKKSEKKETKVHAVKKDHTKDTPDVKQTSTAIVQKDIHMPEKTETREAPATDNVQRDHHRTPSFETRGRLTIGPKPERLETEKDQSKDNQPARKRKMSVMEMKKQNRRMSLFEQAEANRDRTRENRLEEEVKRRMVDMRRKGSIAADLLNPDGMQVMPRKPLSRNNNFQEVFLEDSGGQEDSDSSNNFDTTDKQNCFRNTTANAIDSIQQNSVKTLVEKFNFSNGNSINTAEDYNEDQNQTRMNSADITYSRTSDNGENKLKRKVVNPCRSWSGCLLDSESTRSFRDCGLCGNKDCMYINGLWQTVTLFQMNVLKCDIQSSRAVNDCLKTLVLTASQLSDSDLFQMSLNIES